MPPLQSFLDRGHRANMPPQMTERVADCLRAIQRKMKMDPFKHHFIIDAQTGQGPHFKLDLCPTITAGRGGAGGIARLHAHQKQ